MRYHDEVSRRNRNTLISYLSAIIVLVAAVAWSGRSVLFQPWTARDWISGAAAGDRLYLFGGRDSGGNGYAEIYRVDPQSRRLRRSGALPSPRYGMAVASTDRGILILGGWDGTAVSDDILRFDPASSRVTLIGKLPAPRAFCSAAAIGGLVYCAGGWSGSSLLDDILEVDPSTGATRIIGRLPSPREHVAAAASGGMLYVIGGADARDYLDEVLEISPRDGTVLRKAHLPSGRTRAGALALASGVVVIGGWTGRELYQALLIDPRRTELAVRELPALPRGFSNMATAAIGSEVYIAGGVDERLHRQIGLWSWNPETGESRSVTLRSFLGW